MPSDYAALPTVKNPDYYTADSSTPMKPATAHYDSLPSKVALKGNGQMAQEHTTTETTTFMKPGVTAHYKNGYDHDVTWKASDTNKASNYAMSHTEADKWNGGVHMAQGLSNTDYFGKYSATKYSLLNSDYR